MVKGMIEHADDFTAFVVHDTLLLLVVESWDCETTIVILVVLKVDLPEVSEAFVKRIWSRVFAWNIFIGLREPPSCTSMRRGGFHLQRGKRLTFRQHLPVHRVIGNDIFQSLEFTDNHCTMSW